MSLFLHILLLPFSLLYGLGVWVRNTLFDMEVLPSVRYDVPVISVGNITVGGTGKTPLTEYLVRLLAERHRVAVLSRGYKRRSKGFQLAEQTPDPKQLGDEPTQIKRKFPTVTVAVDANRRNGLDELTRLNDPAIEVVVMDDAFQHRYVTPGLSLLLIDYNRPLKVDHLLPAGNLREPASQLKRADVVLITKCPPDMRPIEQRLLIKDLKLKAYQRAFFTTMEQGNWEHLLESSICPNRPQNESTAFQAHNALYNSPVVNRPVLLLAGIASPQPFIKHLKAINPEAKTLLFPDHHAFSDKDIAQITTTFKPLRERGGIIVTTEKDGVRLLADTRFESLWPYCYLSSITLRFLNDEEALFNKKMLDYVRLNKRNSSLDQAAHL